MLLSKVIDGQHRLFAFEDSDSDGQEYHLPVVAFSGLDISWQAYLFWTINIKPKKINPSLAFDLYPLLREEDWLDAGEVVHVYKESRAQELTELLWSNPTSPWYRRINMLGGARKEHGPVTQASFIRSLVASMVKSWKPSGMPGGIFGGTVGTQGGLSWSRLQQGAFLLTAWKLLAAKVKASDEDWATEIRRSGSQVVNEYEDERYFEPAFTSSDSLLATDQGVRGFQHILNDIFYENHDKLSLSSWRDSTSSSDITPQALGLAVESLQKEPAFDFLSVLCEELATFDWRASSASGLSEDERQAKAALRGSGGYRELRNRLTVHLRRSSNELISHAALQLKT